MIRIILNFYQISNNCLPIIIIYIECVIYLTTIVKPDFLILCMAFKNLNKVNFFLSHVFAHTAARYGKVWLHIFLDKILYSSEVNLLI